MNQFTSSSIDEVLEEEIPLVCLKWTDVVYSVSIKAQDGTVANKEVLHGVSGYANPGELLVIMGPSGAGKTTLMNLLANRVAIGAGATLTGTILANDDDIHSIAYENYVAYVMQEDILLATMTVRECLQFSCDLRTRGEQHKKDRKVERLLDDLVLRKCKDSQIGSALKRGVSGGERKRVCIGVEIITNPSVIFLDEPTSGLDSYTALAIVRLLKRNSKRGRTVVTTLHQPSSDIYKLFDKLLIVADGNIVFHGPPYDSIGYFNQAGFPFPEYGNPADSIMKVVSLKRKDQKSAEEQERYRSLMTLYSANKQEILAGVTPNYMMKLDKQSTDNKAPWGLQFSRLMRRSVQTIIRTPQLSWSKVFLSLFFSILTLSLYYDMGKNKKGQQNREGLLFFVCTTWFIQGLAGISLTCKCQAVPSQRAVFLKEQGQKAYSVLPYFMTKIIPELVFEILGPLVYCMVIYWATNLNDHDLQKPFIFSKPYTALAAILCHMAGASFGLLLGCLIGNVQLVLALGPVIHKQAIIFICTVFTGYLVNTDSLPVATRWLIYISPFKYAFSAMALNEFHNETLHCGKDALGNEIDCDPLGELNLTLSMWENMLLLFMIMCVARIAAFLSLKYKVQKLA
jgi:ABC-type multidrug transport system ATPase subunit/ABC-type multidrug transport system permease subunit